MAIMIFDITKIHEYLTKSSQFNFGTLYENDQIEYDENNPVHNFEMACTVAYSDFQVKDKINPNKDWIIYMISCLCIEDDFPDIELHNLQFIVDHPEMVEFKNERSIFENKTLDHALVDYITKYKRFFDETHLSQICEKLEHHGWFSKLI